MDGIFLFATKEGSHFCLRGRGAYAPFPPPPSPSPHTHTQSMNDYFSKFPSDIVIFFIQSTLLVELTSKPPINETCSELHGAVSIKVRDHAERDQRCDLHVKNCQIQVQLGLKEMEI